MKKKGIAARLPVKFKSIQSSIFCAVSILVLSAVLAVTVVSLRYTNSSIYENSVMYTQTIIGQLNQNIDSYISYMDNIASLVAGSGDAYKYLYSESGIDALSLKEYNQCRQRLTEQFKTILKGRSDIRNIGIVRRENESSSLFNNGMSTRNQNLKLDTQHWYADAVGKYDHYNLTSSHVQNVISGERPWVITLSRGIRNYTGEGDSDGVVFIDLNYSAISELCTQNSVGTKGYVFILDQDGNIVYHPQQQQLYNELQTENISLIMNAKTDVVTAGKGDDEKIYALSHSETTGWTIVGCMNMSELLKNSRKARSIYVLVALGLIAVALVISSEIARNITFPIQKLRDSMKRVQKGDFSAAEIEVYSDNEIGSLTRSFNVMTHKIQDLMAQNIQEQEQKRKIELKALQSQINPHFLYNTLDSIIWMAEGKKNEEVVLMTASLARLLRQSISIENELVTIGQEVEYVRSYLTIQKMRYKDKLEFEINVDPRITHAQIIRLVLQPIVENAIYHGLKYKESKGMLKVHGYELGERIIIDITDDGVGMDEETLKHIYDKHKVNYHSNGVGVYNVQQRLVLYYGKEYGIIYHSEKGKGTTATVVIPKKQEDVHEKI
ncbi:HAMP domain-containing protein [Blautia wexlerae]|uniref:histidine kinase n=1 Tax=Blautia wexlerae TaxID=418240 RepID=A0ABX2GIP8_9FIRM|nr:sensor histidine kinase [Blautia wexlerae]NSF72241.1 HAMP domain-containing protein [Blautia wexlerae]